MLIDKIILSKIKDFTPDECTGGSIQISGSKYTKSLNINLIIFFGYTSSRNSISRKIKIKEDDISILSKELLLKTKKYLDDVCEEDFVLDINEILEENSVLTSYEMGTKIVRGSCIGSDSVDNIDSSKTNATEQVPTLKQKSSKSKKLTDTQNEDFEFIWKEYELGILIKIAGRNPESKSEIKKLYEKLIIDNKIESKTIIDYISESCDGKAEQDAKYFLGLRKIFNDIETFKELQREKNENK